MINARAQRLTLLTVVAVVAIFLLFISYPRLSSSIVYIPVDAALDRHWKDYPIRSNQFPVLIKNAETAIGKLNQARYWKGLAWLHYLQAQALGVLTPKGQRALKLSGQSFEYFLAKSPASPASWLRLAWINALLEKGSGSVLNPLMMSIYTGRAERYLILNRLELALQHIENLREGELSTIRDQIQLAWRFYQKDFLRYIKSGTFKKQSLLLLIVDSHPQLTKDILDKL